MSQNDIEIGPFNVSLTTKITRVARLFDFFYADFPKNQSSFSDFHISLQQPVGLRHFVRPQVDFFLDGKKPFKPLALDNAFAFFEWGLNWCIASYAHQYLLIHSAVIEKNGVCVIMPAPPGSGKSTLCAALVNRGWRLFSDEFSLVSLSDGLLLPIPRPISLKNNSIDIIQNFAPDCILGPKLMGTTKGTVAHMKAPHNSIINSHKKAPAKFIIFPQFKSNSSAQLTPYSKGNTLMKLAANSFNYSVLRGAGFAATSRLVDACDCYQFQYSNLEHAVELFDALIENSK